jgi:hypothetical protein
MRISHLVAAGLAALVLTACSTEPSTKTDIVVVKPVPPTRVVVVKPAPRPAPPPRIVVVKPKKPVHYVKKTVITTRRY